MKRTSLPLLLHLLTAANGTKRRFSAVQQEEVTKPGFYHNLHSINHFHISSSPWFADLQLADKVTYITPRYEFGQAHRDGSALVFGRNLEETIASIARFSTKDAAAFREWNKKAEEITRRVLLPERYSEPVPQAERERLGNSAGSRSEAHQQARDNLLIARGKWSAFSVWVTRNTRFPGGSSLS